MKLRKNVNINSLVERFKQIQNEAGILANHFQQSIQLFDDTKLGISELNFKIDEDVQRFYNTYAKIEDLIRGL